MKNLFILYTIFAVILVVFRSANVPKLKVLIVSDDKKFLKAYAISF